MGLGARKVNRLTAVIRKKKHQTESETGHEYADLDTRTDSAVAV
jgi:hypothetical protein